MKSIVRTRCKIHSCSRLYSVEVTWDDRQHMDDTQEIHYYTNTRHL